MACGWLGARTLVRAARMAGGRTVAGQGVRKRARMACARAIRVVKVGRGIEDGHARVSWTDGRTARTGCGR